MQIRLTFTNAHGREETRVADLPAVPPVGSIVAEYPARPSANRPQPVQWQLRVVGLPEFHVIGRAVDVLVPCEVVE